MYIRRLFRGIAFALLVCAAAVAAAPVFLSLGTQSSALTVALAFEEEKLSSAGIREEDAGSDVLLAAIVTLQITAIVAFEGWAFTRRRRMRLTRPSDRD
jgi:hypothetical protein